MQVSRCVYVSTSLIFLLLKVRLNKIRNKAHLYDKATRCMFACLFEPISSKTAKPIELKF